MKEPLIAELERLNDMIVRNDTKGCPDPVGGGCVGHYCTQCATRAIKGTLRELEQRIDQLKR